MRQSSYVSPAALYLQVAFLVPTLPVPCLPQPLGTPAVVKRQLLWFCTVLGDGGNSALQHLPDCREPEPTVRGSMGGWSVTPQVPKNHVPVTGQDTIKATLEQCLGTQFWGPGH